MAQIFLSQIQDSVQRFRKECLSNHKNSIVYDLRDKFSYFRRCLLFLNLYFSSATSRCVLGSNRFWLSSRNLPLIYWVFHLDFSVWLGSRLVFTSKSKTQGFKKRNLNESLSDLFCFWWILIRFFKVYLRVVFTKNIFSTSWTSKCSVTFLQITSQWNLRQTNHV